MICKEDPHWLHKNENDQGKDTINQTHKSTSNVQTKKHTHKKLNDDFSLDEILEFEDHDCLVGVIGG
ncbi:uncharacterized protein MELLADRAFT_70641 [Melampsora larici-populina 98AG31]|uniref:Uncharacterized protein n=1 Tax=Melampsora larici-populina (strain 98AG31 / pathotype 3-4-7) TaxID=747676 RepID=F4R707_MELLP|nr:uncharacterized protein MELLADRAFT_70641 [Melampsora larici-populina 98AG31]EGG11962.1 hypothetical protein MELLADRAFT_70641 [Melampsora larici-populina 98AG31]